VCFSSQGREDGKGSKSRKLSGSESAEKLSKRKDGGSKSAMDNRLIQMSMTGAQGGDDGGTKDAAPRGKTDTEQSSRGSRNANTDHSGSSHVDKVGVSAADAGTREKRKPAVEPKEKSAASKSQHKTKESAATSEKDKGSRQSERKVAEGSGKRKPRTVSTSSASSDSSSSSSSSSSGSSSSGSSSSTSSSSSEASTSRKQRQQRTTAKSKSDTQRVPSSGSKTHRSKDVTKPTNKIESGKLSGKESSQRSREKVDEKGQKEQSGSRGSGRWKEDSEATDRHRVAAADSRKDGRQRSGRDEKVAEYSPHRSRDDDVERHVTPGVDQRLQHDSSMEYRQERMSARYSGDHRRSGRYDADEHYDRLQHPADFEVSDRYRAGLLDCHYSMLIF